MYRECQRWLYRPNRSGECVNKESVSLQFREPTTNVRALACGIFACKALPLSGRNLVNRIHFSRYKYLKWCAKYILFYFRVKSDVFISCGLCQVTVLGPICPALTNSIHNFAISTITIWFLNSTDGLLSAGEVRRGPSFDCSDILCTFL